MVINRTEKVVIGIDPGTATVGYAISTGTKKNPVILDYGVLHTEALPKEQMPNRLVEIGSDLEILLEKYNPTHAIIEDLFFFKNITTAISVAQSRGVLLYILAKRGVSILSLTPLEIKQGISGYGRATKKQVQTMVQKVYQLPTPPKPDDAADALAMAWLGL
jgi:crossover junction endodeoxyribonuclease RuvC